MTARSFCRPLCVSLMLLAAGQAWAAPKELASAGEGTSSSAGGLNIVAVVGGDAISSYDVNARIQFILATTNMSDTPDVVKNIRPQVIRSLVDERLELQDAKKNDIVVSEDDIKKAIASIEAERGMPQGAIFHQLEVKHVPKDTFINQIRAQIAWGKLVRKNLRANVHVSEEEIRLAEKHVAAPVKKQELKIGVIVLPVDKASRALQVKQMGDKLVSQVRGGANFEEVGRQFGSRGAVTTFWVRPEQLDAAVAKALTNATVGTVTEPVPTEVGFSIVKVYDARAMEDEKEKDVEVQLKEILIQLKPDASDKEADAMVQMANDVTKHPGSCEDKTVANIPNLQDFDIAVNINRTLMSALPPAIKIIAENLKVGDISTPFASREGIRLYMLCDRREAGSPVPDHDRVANLVYQHKMELEAQKYIRQLRRQTYIDVRDK